MINFIFLIILFQSIVYGCQQSYECGNPPFTICQNRLNIYPGIGLNEQTNKLIFMGKFNGSNGPVGNAFVVSIPTSGGNLTSEYGIQSDINTGSGYSISYKLNNYLSSSNTAWIACSQRLSPAIGPYNQITQTFEGIWFPRGYQLGLTFDEINSITYYSEIGIYRINLIPQVVDDRFNHPIITMYNNVRTNFLGRNGNDLYAVVVGYDSSNKIMTQVFKGNVGAVNLAQSDLLLVLTLPFEVDNFYVTSTHFYFSNRLTTTTPNGGIFSLPLSGDLVALRYIVSDLTTSLVVDSQEQFVYYLTVDQKIKKASLPGNHPVVSTLYDSSNSNSNGTCVCSPGFNSDKCSKCSGVVRWTDGNPSCIPILSNGWPATCVYDWECLNVPYTYCSNTCQCRFGFTGAKCDQCSGTINWNSGIPSCSI